MLFIIGDKDTIVLGKFLNGLYVVAGRWGCKKSSADEEGIVVISKAESKSAPLVFSILKSCTIII